MRLGWLWIAVMAVGCGGNGPEAIATGLSTDPSAGLAARNGVVYATDAKEALVRIAPDGGTVALARDAGLAYALKVDEGQVYWTDGTSARWVPLDGGMPRVLETAPDGWNLQDVAPSGGRLFWIETTTDPTLPVQTRLGRGYLVGPLPTATIDTVDGLAFSFAADEGSLYWAGTMGAWRRDLADDATDSLARISEPEVAGNVLSDGSQVVWTEQDPSGDALWGRTAPGGAALKLSDIGRARALAIDAKYVYLRTDRSSDGSCIERAPRGGGEAVPIAKTQADGFSLAVDDSAVFWLEAGQLMRLLKADVTPDPGLCGG